MADFLVSETEMLEVEHDTTWELFFDFILKEKTAQLNANEKVEYENRKISKPGRESGA